MEVIEFDILNDEFQLRPMSSSDIDQIMAIERASFSSPWSARFFFEEIGVTYSRSLVAMHRGRIIGYIVYWELPTDVDIHNLAVHPDCRRRGIGRALLTATINHAKEQGFDRITLEVRRSNRIAQRLYQSLGFVTTGLRKGYYSNDSEDAVGMALQLKGGRE